MDALRAALAVRKEKRKEAGDAAAGASQGGVEGAAVKRFRTKKDIEEEKRLERLQPPTPATLPTSTSSSNPLPSTLSDCSADERKQPGSSSASARGRSSSPSPSPPPPPPSSEVEPALFEVKRRLRSFGHPVSLFGESPAARWQRLKAVELSRVEREGEGRGRNRFHEILTSEVESDLKHVLLQELERARAPHAHSAHSTTLPATADDSTAPAPPPSSSSSSSSSHPTQSSAQVKLTLSDFPSPHRFIVYFLKRLLAEWEAELEQRPAEVRRSLQGKVESATQKQTREAMRPLFTLLKAQQVDADILTHTLAIVQHCTTGRWKEADEAYLTLAIGNAPWPMGVTMVGIHERSGREKIFSDHVAHVLNDETARKYIQGIKRLMTWCRTHYPQGWGGGEGGGGAAGKERSGEGDGAAQQVGVAAAVGQDGDEKG